MNVAISDPSTKNIDDTLSYVLSIFFGMTVEYFFERFIIYLYLL